MRTYAFLDLDDTLFQTLPKCPPGAPVHPVARAQDGQALSYMTERQQALFALLSREATIVPTTARNHEAYRRVDLGIRGPAILDFGAVILLEDGAPDPAWDAAIRPQTVRVKGRLEAIGEELEAHVAQAALAANVRLVRDFDLSIYLVIKHSRADVSVLERLRDRLAGQLDPQQFFIHMNCNNLAVVPRFLGKERAVHHFIEKHIGRGKALTIGIGDSLTDGAFLDLCDFSLVPRQSQLARAGRRHRPALPPPPPFSGSFLPEDALFLLKPVQLESTPVADKERLIQSGSRHYSEMIHHEALPSPAYMQVFHEALSHHRARFASDLLILAGQIASARSGPIALVSLVRAGTPTGVLLARILRRHLGREVVHYSVSIIRDRGIDARALDYIVERHPPSALAFVDGWTGKGVIASELARAIQAYNREHSVAIDAGLFAVSDLSGTAAEAASAEDYLIPSSILGATVSGLVSRSILNSTVVGPDDFHGCLYYRDFEPHDLSRWFIDTVMEEVSRAWAAGDGVLERGVTPDMRAACRARALRFLTDMRERYEVLDPNHIKPGIGEATRVLLRRVPDRLFLRAPGAADVAHLVCLAQEKEVPIVVDPELPYQAAALIRELERA